MQYFILDTIDLKLYGGLNFEQFKQQRIDLGVSDKLILKDVDSYPKQE